VVKETYGVRSFLSCSDYVCGLFIERYLGVLSRKGCFFGSRLGLGCFASYMGKKKVDGLVLGEVFLTTGTLRESNDERTLTG